MTCLAVVPIFVNAGAALLPALVAGVASALAVLFKPRELWQLCRRRPMTPVAVVTCAAAVGMGGWWVVGGAQASAKARNPAGIDWIKVAEQIAGGEGKAELATSERHASVFRFDYSRCGHDGGASPVKLHRKWRFDADGATILSSPLVANGRVYGATYFQDVAGSAGEVFCLDAATGQAIWRTAADGDVAFKPFFSSPALSEEGKYVLIGQGLHPDKDCDLICLEADSGKVHWRVKTPLHIEGSPAVKGDMVVAGAGAIEGPDHKPTGDPGMVIAVRISDGKVLWTYAVNDPESSPAISNEGIVFIGSGFQGNAVIALRTETDEQLQTRGLSRLLWKAPTPYPVTGAVTLAGDLVIVGAGNSDYVNAAPDPAGLVMALDVRTGQVRWKKEMGDAVLGPVAARDGKVICPVRTGHVVALDQKDGKELWRVAISGNVPILAGPAFTGTHVYAVSGDGVLAVVDVGGPTVLEKHTVNSTPGTMGLSLSSPIVVGGHVFVGSETGGVSCYGEGR